MVTTQQIRVHPDMLEIINYIKVQYLKNLKKAPTTIDITHSIAKRIKKEELLYEDFIEI